MMVNVGFQKLIDIRLVRGADNCVGLKGEANRSATQITGNSCPSFCIYSVFIFRPLDEEGTWGIDVAYTIQSHYRFSYTPDFSNIFIRQTTLLV